MGVLFDGQQLHVGRIVRAALGEGNDVVDLVAFGYLLQPQAFEEGTAVGVAALDLGLARGLVVFSYEVFGCAHRIGPLLGLDREA